MQTYAVFPPRGYVAPANSQQPGSSTVPTDAVYLAFDALVSEAPEYMGTLTKSTIETGSVISDHQKQNPLRLQVEGIISDTPLPTAPARGQGNTPVGQASGGRLPSKVAYDWLENLYLTKGLFDFVGGFKVYKQMMIAEWRPTRTPETGGALSFSMVLEQVTVVSTQELYQPTKKILQKKVSHGSVPLKPLSAAQKAAIQDQINAALGPLGASESFAPEDASAVPLSSGPGYQAALANAFPGL